MQQPDKQLKNVAEARGSRETPSTLPARPKSQTQPTSYKDVSMPSTWGRREKHIQGFCCLAPGFGLSPGQPYGLWKQKTAIVNVYDAYMGFAYRDPSCQAGYCLGTCPVRFAFLLWEGPKPRVKIEVESWSKSFSSDLGNTSKMLCFGASHQGSSQ